ncbi:ankyrin repeat domain-containing protein [Carboxylicivirga sediminis]|uniref:Ankyrin repeat domain-containing protein n=1 Tax=Carboxylicivirga sediminis TaxID=2006564 RepID=A0A941F5C4_9BACT|nr:ankyrin repeat domain-containing protein [Carboxylicivirga sediminis]MBR8537116.1 ankyrin repeat domain-containing protein [Carboxylicivirga sediminis]
MKYFIKKSLLLGCFGLSLFACKVFKMEQVPESFAYIYQSEQEKPLYAGQTEIEVDPEAFSIRFVCGRFDEVEQQFYNMRIAAFLSESQMPNIYPGIPADSLPCFGAGTGMAPSQNEKYEVLNINSNAHHYLFYQDETSNRVKLLSEKDEQLMLEFEVDSLGFWGHNEEMSQARLSEFYLLLYKDANLNRRIDEGEWSKVTIRLKGNYREWSQPFWNQQDSLGQTPLHHLFLLNQWADCGDRQRLSILEQACMLPEVNLNLQDAYGNTALHYAVGNYYMHDVEAGRRCNKGHDLRLIQALLHHDGCDVNRTNYYYCNNPLQEYLMAYETGVNRISQRGVELIKLFLQREGLNLNHQNNVLFTAYDYAERKNWLDDVNDELIEQLKADKAFHKGATYELWMMLNQVDFNVTELDTAFFTENIKLCLDYNANPNGRQDASTPLAALCDTRHRPYGYDENEIASNMRLRAVLINQLINATGCDVNGHDGEGLTALHHAVRNDNAELVEALVENSDTDLNVQNALGNTPLMDALQNLRFRLNDAEQAKDCIRCLTNELERTNLHLVNYEGHTLSDLLKRQIGDKAKISSTLYPGLHQLLVDLNEKVERLL